MNAEGPRQAVLSKIVDMVRRGEFRLVIFGPDLFRHYPLHLLKYASPPQRDVPVSRTITELFPGMPVRRQSVALRALIHPDTGVETAGTVRKDTALQTLLNIRFPHSKRMHTEQPFTPMDNRLFRVKHF